MTGALSPFCVLNLLWLAIVSAGVGSAVRFGSLSAGRGGAVRRLMAMAVAAVVLFPCISATDDAWRFEIFLPPDASSFMCSDWDPAGGAESKPIVPLARVFSALEHYQAPSIFQAFLVLRFASLIALSDARRLVRAVVPANGRDPPPHPYA